MYPIRRNTTIGAVGFIGLSLCLFLPLTAKAANIAPSGPFADVPLGDPAYAQFEALEQDMYGFVVPPEGKREKTHIERVLGLTDAVSALTDTPPVKGFASRSIRPDAKQRLKADPKTLAGLHILLRRFAPMMRAMEQKLGPGDAPVNAGLAYFRQPFTDVPPSHWAASSVDELRKAGILVGYHPPDPSDGRGGQLLPPALAASKESQELFSTSSR